LEHERDSPKLNVFCAISHRKICGPFFFTEATVTGATYLDMLEQWLLPQLEEDTVDFIFQHDSAPRITITTFGATSMTDCHNDGLAVQLQGIKNCCVGHRVPQISPCVISSCVVTSRIVPPLSNTLDNLRARITAAITEIDPNMLQRVWEELDYRLDVCRVTRGAHIEHL
jgi:hypothetical protein